MNLQLVSAADLQLLSSHLRAKFQVDGRVPFSLTDKLLSNVQTGASSGAAHCLLSNTIQAANLPEDCRGLQPDCSAA